LAPLDIYNQELRNEDFRRAPRLSYRCINLISMNLSVARLRRDQARCS